MGRRRTTRRATTAGRWTLRTLRYCRADRAQLPHRFRKIHRIRHLAIRIAPTVHSVRLGLQPPTHHPARPAHHRRHRHRIPRRRSSGYRVGGGPTADHPRGGPTRRPPATHPAGSRMGPPGNQRARRPLGCRRRGATDRPGLAAHHYDSDLASTQPACTAGAAYDRPAERLLGTNPHRLVTAATVANHTTAVGRRTHPGRPSRPPMSPEGAGRFSGRGNRGVGEQRGQARVVGVVA